MQIDYFCALTSPWTHMGHQRLAEIVARSGATVRVMPLDGPSLFSRTGGLPLPKRAPERRAYRMQELVRWRDRLGLDYNLEPAFFPADDTEAGLMVIAAREEGRDAFDLAGRFLRAVWVEERNIADAATINAIMAEAGMDPDGLRAAAERIDAAAIRSADTDAAVAAGVFGFPTYRVGDSLFWGQDRIDFLAEAVG